MKIYSAEWVLPIDREPFENGAILIENDKISEVGAAVEVIAKYPQAQVENCGAAAITPGFVNAHSHLEITAMRGFLDSVEHDFAAWLLKLTKTRGEILTDEDVKTAAIFGTLEGVRAGVTCFGDIGRLGIAGFEALKISGLRGILFQETDFSPDNKTAAEDFEKLIEKFSRLRETETNLVKVGLSPHSPYTVSAKLYEKIARYSIENDVAISTHAAESNDETELLKNGTGFFIEVYKKFGVEWQSPRCSSIEFLARNGVLDAKPLLAHCIKVSDSDIQLIKNTDSRVAHCPKSNAKFGHGIAPLEKFLDAKIKTGFGSDSVASNNVCDILEEARFAALFARTLPDKKRFLTDREIIKTATLGGAKALGLESQIGTLTAGKQADFCVVSLENAAQMPVHDVHAALLYASNARDVVMTVVAGEEIFRDNKSQKIDEKEIKLQMKQIAAKMKN